MRLRLVMPLVNWVGAVVIYLYFAWVFPPSEHKDVFDPTSVNAAVGAVYVLLATVFARWRSDRANRVLLRWRESDAPPTEDDRREILRIPALMVSITALLWGVSIPVFFAWNLQYGLALAVDVAGSIFMGGLTTSAAVYLLAERITRPALAYALDPRERNNVGVLGIAPRIVLTWILLSGVPLIGIITVPLGRSPAEPADLVTAMVFLAVVAFGIGLIGMKVVAQNLARPVRSLHDAIDRVAEGDTDVEVRVDDGSEIGRLQAGFNDMVDGLRERERLRELFGRQVGDDVAREALERGVTLGGQRKTVSALFVDVVGSTSLASRERPERVVELLNQFFAAVVEVVTDHGGLVNKFEGDGAMCVFGAPVERDDSPQAALAAARQLGKKIAEESPLDAAIGVSCGTAVAGHVGAEARYEYTVIGDPVNEAARLCELAKQRPGRTLASAQTVDMAGEPESSRWQIDGQERLRGRSQPTRLACPRERVRSASASAA